MRRDLVVGNLAGENDAAFQMRLCRPEPGIVTTRAVANDDHPASLVESDELIHRVKQEIQTMPRLETSNKADDGVVSKAVAGARRIGVCPGRKAASINAVRQTGHSTIRNSLSLDIPFERL